jgi:hypothetical protein
MTSDLLVFLPIPDFQVYKDLHMISFCSILLRPFSMDVMSLASVAYLRLSLSGHTLYTISR